MTFGYGQVFRLFEKLGFNPVVRVDASGEIVVTDMGNHIIDLHLAEIKDPERLANLLDETVGVVEHGLFNGMVKKVIVGSASEGVKVITK